MLRASEPEFRALPARIQVYSTALCPYCVAAKNFLVGKGLSYEEIRVDNDPVRFAEMLQRSSNKRSVPQIFVDDTHVGGFNELIALDRSGELGKLLGSA
jgi:glutaredoxin 3